MPVQRQVMLTPEMLSAPISTEQLIERITADNTDPGIEAYCVVDPNATPNCLQDLYSISDNIDAQPIYLGTKFEPYAEHGPLLVKYHHALSPFLAYLLEHHAGIVLTSTANLDTLATTLGKQLTMRSETQGEVYVRFYAPSVALPLLSTLPSPLVLNPVSSVMVPTLSRRHWQGFEIPATQPTSNDTTNRPVATINLSVHKALEEYRIANWLAQLSSWHGAPDSALLHAGQQVHQLMQTGITSQMALIEWANWLQEHLDITYQAQWQGIVNTHTPHQERIAAAKELAARIQQEKGTTSCH